MITVRLAGSLLFFIGTVAGAEDAGNSTPPAAQKVDPAGTWTWSVPNRRGGPDLTNVLVLKKEGDVLTGQLQATGRNGVTNLLTLQNASLGGSNLSFSVNRNYQAYVLTADYTGTVNGDAINGKIRFERTDNGVVRTNNWTARRQSNKTDMIPEKSDAAAGK